MTFPELKLDDRNFQDLVSEARGRIAESCPEWTEHNVSDPGITLIETFAWMTDILLYRLNRLPEKLHMALLQLLDLELGPPGAAHAELRFRLAGGVADPVRIPEDQTEVTAGAGEGQPIVFRVRRTFTINPIRPSSYVLVRSQAEGGNGMPSVGREVTVSDGVARPDADDQPAFSDPPRVGDALYLGFEDSLDRLVIRVEVKGTKARGVGIEPATPPLRWEASGAKGWVEAEVLEDTTGGFNLPDGYIELQLPRRTKSITVANEDRFWLRCRVTRLTRLGHRSPRYTDPPRIASITAYPVGALVPAEHAATAVNEVLPNSDGTPGQRFVLRHVPALTLDDDEYLEVQEPGSSEWVRWERCDSFDASSQGDLHYRFDPAAAEIELGPAIRTRSAWKQHGRIPPVGSRLRINHYRYGGGERGNVTADSLRQLRNPIAGVVGVTNPRPASGGVDAESIDAARRRAAHELRTRYRAVTAEDFEFLAGEASVKVGRVRCTDPGPNGVVPVYVMPAVSDPERPLSLYELTPDDDLLKTVAKYLDERRLVGLRVHVSAVELRGVTAVVDVEVDDNSRADLVQQRVERELYLYLNPLVGGGQDAEEGWEFGRPVVAGELSALVRRIPGVRQVRWVRMYETDLNTPGTPSPQPAGPRIDLMPNELVCSASHRVRARHRDGN